MVRLFVIKLLFTQLTEHLTHVDISFVLSHGDGQAGQSAQPVTLHLGITVSADGTPLSDSTIIPTRGDDSPAEEVPELTVAPDSRGHDHSTAPELPLPPPDHLPVRSGVPVPQGQSEAPLVEKARTGLDLAAQAEKSIDGSNTWQAVVGKIKWVMDTLSPLAGVRVISFLPVLD